MQFTCDRIFLTAAATTALRGTSAKSSVPALEGLLVEAYDTCVKITGYDLKTGITCEIPAVVEEKGACVLSARLFCDIVRRMPGDSIEVTLRRSSKVTVKSENAKYEIISSPYEDYPELPHLDGEMSFSLGAKTLKELISQTVFAVSDNDTRPIYMGELFEIEGEYLTAVAVDGSRLALKREKIEGETANGKSFIVPGIALKEVERIAASDDSEVEIICGAKHVMFKMPETTIISRRLEGEFLNYRSAIPSGGKYTVGFDRREMLDAVERVSLIVNDNVRSPLRCTFDEGKITLLTVSPLGQATDRVSSDGDGEKIEVGFNNRYLLDVFRAAPEDSLKIRITSPTSPCVIVPEDGSESFLYMILPVRLSADV